MFSRNRLVCTDWYETEDYIWMCLSDQNAICKVNKATGEVKKLGYYPNHGASQYLLASSVVFCNGKIVFVPCLADSVAVVDMETDLVTFIPLPKQNYPLYDIIAKFVYGFAEDGYIYMQGFAYPAILRLTVDSGELAYFAQYSKRNRNKYSCLGMASEGKRWFFPMVEKGEIMRFFPESKKIEYQCMDGENGGFFGLAQEGERIWLTCLDSDKDYIVSWDMEKNKVEKVLLPARGRYHAPLFYQGVAYLFPHEGKAVVMIDLNDGFKASICREISDKLCFGDWAAVMAVKQIGTTIKFVTGGTRCWYEYDLENHMLSETYYELKDDAFLQDWMKDAFLAMTNRQENATVENELLLSEFMQIIGENSAEEVSAGENYGKKIYDFLKEM